MKGIVMPMQSKRLLLASTCVLGLLAAPAFARGGGGGAFVGGFLGSAVGSVVGNALTQPAAPAAPVYVAPSPVYVAPQRIYVAPQRVYAQPAYTLAAQQRLHDLGLLVGPVDGVFGDNTQRAIINWQTIHGRPATGYLSNDDLVLLFPAAPVAVPVPVTVPVPVAVPPPVAVVPAVPVTAVSVMPAASVVPASAAVPAPRDPFAGVKTGMPYGEARQKLVAAGWQTGFFNSNNVSDSDRDNRAYFSDHHIMEVEDCSASGCAMQFHNNDGRLLYVFTEPGNRGSDAYRGAGPAVIGICPDHKDMACAPDTSNQGQAQAAR